MLGTGGGELTPSLFLFTDTKRYLFNCGENLQRFCIEHKVRLSRLQNLFITRVSWENLGGLAGLAISLRPEGGASEINLHGPEALTKYVTASRFFLGQEKVLMNTRRDDVESAHEYKDENVTIATIHIQAATPYEDISGDSASDSEGAQTAQPQAKRATKSDSVAAFICKLVDIPGKFNPAKAKELGLPRGPDYRKLVSGESVTTSDGKVIRPSEVMGPKQKGPTFVVLECPHLGFVPSITTHPSLQSDAFTGTEQSVMLIAHIAPEEVLQSEAYSRWMASFGPDTKHLLLGGSLCPSEVSMRSMLKMQCPLYLMSPSIHPLPAMQEETRKDLQVYQKLPRESIIIGHIHLKYILKPSQKAGVDDSSILRPVREVVEEQISDICSNLKLAAAVKHPDRFSDEQPSYENEGGSQWFDISEKGSTAKPASKLLLPSSPTLSPPLSPDDAVITFQGTGAACPSKYRNVSGILLQTFASGNLLLDCGEGTLSQIYKCFGRQGGDDIIRNLKVVFISHIHGDHHLGVISVLQRRNALMRSVVGGAKSERTLLIGPPLFKHWLSEYSRGCERVFYRFIACDELLAGSCVLEDCSIQTVPVVHCKKAYGVILAHKAGWKIVYSGDTRPCLELAEAGQDATLLIHEATFEDNLQDDAIAKKHCTISEALEIAKQMNPKFTILTHFSQRYPKVPPALFNNGNIKSRVALAFDCMRVHLSEVHMLPSYLPAIKEIFAVVLADDVNEPGLSWSW